ncbi:MAG: flagellar export protein FliJ [Rhodocyclaceae bacterium]|nr:flagellar export protein FliJ [Rhodocyclaceae bacterium]
MKRQFPLQSLLDLSQVRLDEATRLLGELISGQQEAAQRLELLQQYRDEYQTRFLAAAQTGIGRDAWHNYRAFLERLDAAVAQAKDMVAASERRTAAGQLEWLNKRGRVKAFDTLAQRHQSRVVHAESKQEQKAFDEHAARRHHEKDLAGK